MFGKKNTEEKKDTAPQTGGKVLRGVVTSTKMQDTVVVEVKRYYKHPKYQKYITENKKYKAHDKGNTKSVGDKVEIKEVRPISKDKHFVVV